LFSRISPVCPLFMHPVERSAVQKLSRIFFYVFFCFKCFLLENFLTCFHRFCFSIGEIRVGSALC